MSQENERLPEGWAEATVGELCTLVNGRAFKPAEWSIEGLPIIRIQNLNNPAALFNYFDGELDPKFEVSSGDLLFAWSGTPGTSFGAHIWKGHRAALNQHIFRVQYNPNVIDKEYFRLALNDRLAEMIGRAQGGVGLAHITKGKFESTKILVPPLSEQRRIVAKIGELQAHSRRTREALEGIPPLLERFRQSVLAAAFRGDLTADWRARNPDVEPASVLLERIRAERRRHWEEAELAKIRGKGKEANNDHWKQKYEEPAPVDTSKLPGLPKGWEWVSLDQLLTELRNGISTKPDALAGTRILRISAVRPLGVDLRDVRYLAEQNSNFESYMLQEGDLLFTRYNGNPSFVGVCGAVPRLPYPMVYPDKLIRSRVIRPHVLFEFVEIVANAGASRAFIEQQVKSSAGQSGISGTDLKRTPIPLPPYEEQLKVASTVRALLGNASNLESVIKAGRSQGEALERAVVSKALRGELVPQDPNDEPASTLLQRIRSERERDGARVGRGRRPARPTAP